MMPMKRQQELLSKVDSQGIISVRELAESLGVSESTVRRDLRELEAQNRIRVSHGGVASLRSDANSLWLSYAGPEEQTPEKTRIGREAAKLVQESETVFIDSGSTVLAMAQAIEQRKRFTCITNSLAVANVLCENQLADVVMLGGSVNAHDKSVSGRMAFENLQRFFISRYFLGTAGISEQEGVTGFNLSLIELRQSIARMADEVIVLADASKLRKRGMAHVCSLDSIDKVITDSGITEEELAMLEAHGIEVIVA